MDADAGGRDASGGFPPGPAGDTPPRLAVVADDSKPLLSDALLHGKAAPALLHPPGPPGAAGRARSPGTRGG